MVVAEAMEALVLGTAFRREEKFKIRELGNLMVIRLGIKKEIEIEIRVIHLIRARPSSKILPTYSH